MLTITTNKRSSHNHHCLNRCVSSNEYIYPKIKKSSTRSFSLLNIN